MMGDVSPETCWASYKYGIITLDILLHLVGFFFMNNSWLSETTKKNVKLLRSRNLQHIGLHTGRQGLHISGTSARTSQFRDSQITIFMTFIRKKINPCRFHHKAQAKTYFFELKCSSVLMKEYKSQFNTLVITSRNLQYYQFTITKLLPSLPRPLLLFSSTPQLKPDALWAHRGVQVWQLCKLFWNYVARSHCAAELVVWTALKAIRGGTFTPYPTLSLEAWMKMKKIEGEEWREEYKFIK